MTKKKLNKTYLSIIVVVVLLVVIVAAVYTAQPKREIGVKAGDIFTYSLTGEAVDNTEDGNAVPKNFLDINNVEYYSIEITKVEYPIVSYIETTQFKNGTGLTSEDTVNVESGDTISGGFWGVFIINLKVGSLSRPDVSNGITINSTETRTYLDGERQTNFMRAEAEFYDADDPTLTRKYNAYTFMYIDKQLGVLVELTDMKIYSDPQIMLTVKMELISSNVLQVP